MSGLLEGGWSTAFRASVDGSWTPQRLGLEQLIKHALALNSHAGDRAAHLVYLYWEPLNAPDLQEVTDHRSELARLVELVKGATPELHPLSYGDLLGEWSSLREPDWVTDHTDELRAKRLLRRGLRLPLSSVFQPL